MPSPLPSFNSMTASARILPADKKFSPRYDGWQDQAWAMWEQVSEFEAAVSWRANAMSRLRLIAAEVVPGGDEPVLLTSGPASEAMQRLAGGTGGQAQLMSEMTVHLSVPGEGWLVGETQGPRETWQVYSADEIKTTGRGVYQVREGPAGSNWRALAGNSIVVRFWNRHPRHGWEADSEARHAISALIELDLINKRIVAEIMSRLAFNGILLYDKGVLSFPDLEQPEGADAVDPFAQILVDVAARGIKDPTSPEATIPIPLGFDLRDADRSQVDPKLLMQHIKVVDALDEKLLAERESAVRRLAISLDMPPEVLTGLGDLTHWNAWQVDEQGIKLHIAPTAETICNSLTIGYLEPMLVAAGAQLTGPNGGRIVVWYDPSEITTPPDRSVAVLAAYDRGEVSGRVLRKEIGLNNEGDAPTPAEYVEWLTKFLGRQKETAAGILLDLTGKEIESTQNREGRPPEPESDGPEQQTPPDQPDSGREQGEQSLSAMSTEELQTMTAAAVAELSSREGPSSQWFDSTIPVEQRVTPRSRMQS
jgi:hypothetical protein